MNLVYTLGIDVGGTSIKSGLVTKSGDLTDEQSHPTPQNDEQAEALVERIQQIVESYDGDTLSAVGVAIPGIVSSDGVAEFSASLGYRGVPLRTLLESAINLPVRVVHDVTAAGLAEHRVGMTRQYRNTAVIQIGTGIAASVVIDGKPYRPHPFIGEIGHTPSPYARPCACGLTGCLEMTASGGAMRRNYLAQTGTDLTAAEILQLAHDGDRIAQSLYDEFIDALAGAIIWLSTILGPEAVVLSGGVASAGDSLRHDLARAVSRKKSFHLVPEILVSGDYTRMGCRGAGLMAWAEA